MDSADFGIVLVTTSSEAEGKAIAHALVSSQLAACVTLMPVQSIYTWQGKIHDEPEWQLIVKTRLNKFADLVDKIKAIHSYQVPEVIAIPLIMVEQNYLNWLDCHTRNTSET